MSRRRVAGRIVGRLRGTGRQESHLDTTQGLRGQGGPIPGEIQPRQVDAKAFVPYEPGVAHPLLNVDTGCEFLAAGQTYTVRSNNLLGLGVVPAHASQVRVWNNRTGKSIEIRSGQDFMVERTDFPGRVADITVNVISGKATVSYTLCTPGNA